MSIDHLEAISKTSESDIYAALLLSNILDKQQDANINEVPSLISEADKDPQNVIWVPADKHPQIAPNEFATFIKTHGINTPNRRSVSLQRRKSVLSQSIEDDETELKKSLSEKKRDFLKKVLEEVPGDNSQTFDRNSAALDDSKIIAPKSEKSLLRRSAFSARGRNRKTFSTDDRQKNRRSLSQRKPSSSESVKSNSSWDKSKGVSLYDRPVNLSEWIDLGSASLDSDESQRGIISRVQDAEIQLRTQLDNEQQQETTAVVEEKKEEEKPKRPGIMRSETQTSVPLSVKFAQPSKPEKKTSWLGGLFNDKKKQHPSKSTEVTPSLSSLTNLIYRSLSLKKQPSSITTNTTTNNTNNNNNNNNTTPISTSKIRSSRLEIPPPSERTFFNSNRLPLHVERAIYRLSHMKLTEPRRPLYQQVLISNLMFWYLSIQQVTMVGQQREIVPDIVPTQPKKTTTSKMSRLFFNTTTKKNRNHEPIISPDDEEDDVPLSYYRN